MTTSDTSPPNDSEQMELFATLSPHQRPASRILLQESEEQVATTATSGLTHLDCFARLDQNGLFSKMCLGYVQYNLDGSSETYSETWPAGGLMRSGMIFPLKTSEPRTSASGSGLLPTPRSAMTGDIVPARENDTNNNLERALAREMFPTPRSMDAHDVALLPTQNKDRKRSSMMHEGLARAVTMRPTPRASDIKDGRGKTGNRTPAATLKAGWTLPERAKMFPTPNATDWKGASQPDGRRPVCDDDLPSRIARETFPSPAARDWRSGKGRSENGHTPQLPEVMGGQLSASFVEWMFGLPKDWTKVDPESGTPNGRASRASSPRKPKRSTGANG